MREIEVARGRVVGQRRSTGMVLCSWVVASVLMVALLGCGDATCPAGSRSVDGKCAPANACDGGAECMQESGASGSGDGGSVVPDAEPNGPGKRNDAGGSAGNAGSGGAARDDAGQDAGQPPDDAATPPDAGSDAGQTDPDPEPVGPCIDYTCGAHGTCEVVADAPRCACDPGFTGERCDRCMPGLGLAGDTCVPACEADDAPDCGSHGACEVVDDVAGCACVHPAAGTLCNECATNFKRLADGTCVPDCGDCGPHGYCDGTLMVPDCACYAGYGREANACVWVGDGTTGGIVGGDFTNAEAWEATNATISNGAASFQPMGSGVNCDLGALSQTFHMPTREQSEPLVLELETTTSCTDSNPEKCPPLLVELGSSLTRLRVLRGDNNAPVKHALCLGDAGYGAAVTLRIRPGVASIGLQGLVGAGAASWPGGFDCGHTWPTIASVRIRAAEGACEHGDGVEDPALDSSDAWTLSSGATMAGGAIGLPLEGSATTPFLFRQRTEVKSPALFIAARSNASVSRLEVKLDGLPLAALSISGTRTTQYVCIPDWAHGVAHDLQLTAVAAGATVDSVTVMDQVVCRGGEIDRGFERPLATGSWFIHPFATGNSADLQPIAYDGSSSLSTTSTVLAATMRIPVSQGSGHARLSGVAQTNATSSFTVIGRVAFQGTPSAPTGTTTIQSLTGWPTVSICPGPIWDGQPIFVVASLLANLPNGGTGTPLMRVDDFGVSSSTDCPGP